MAREFTLADTAPGRLVSYGDQSYYRPEPLPPSPPLTLPDKLYELLADATYWLGKLSGGTAAAEFSPLLYTSLLRKEAMESAEIEGANVDYTSVYQYETHTEAASASTVAGETKDAQEVLNYEQAIEFGRKTVSKDGLTEQLLHDLHEVLLTDLPDRRVDTDTIGEYKQIPNHLGAYLPPAPGVTPDLMESLLTYYQTGGNYHALIDIALFHYQFETIHPYGDGNGRLGRLLITLQLIDQEYLTTPNLYLSEYFNRNKRTYIERMEAVRTDGEWVAWLDFFLTGIKQQAEEAVVRTRELATLEQTYLDQYSGQAKTAARLACDLFTTPFVTVTVVADMYDVDRSTAYRAIQSLLEAGILEEVESHGRPAEYRATEIFQILEQPPQTY